MGMTLMADDRDLIIGEIRGGLQAVKEHLLRQDQQRDVDKAEAIKAREENHADNVGRFNRIEQKATETYGLASAAFNWITDKGDPLIKRVDGLHERVKVLEDGNLADAAETRGRASTITFFGSVLVAICSALWALAATFGKDIIEFIKAH